MLSLLALCLAADPVARGLDLYVAAPARVRGDDPIPLAIEVYGFPTAKTWAPIAASLEVSVSAPNQDPVVTRAVTDARGRAIVRAEVPRGPGGQLSVLVLASAGGRQRTRELTVERGSSVELELFVDQLHVVPGTTLEVFARTPGRAHEEVELVLEEGLRALARRVARTDERGLAIASFVVPKARELRVVAKVRGETRARTLSIRDDTPGTARLTASFEGASVRPGGTARLKVRAIDAAGQPVARLPVELWTGLQSAAPKDEEAFRLRALAGATDADGVLAVSVPAPSATGRRGAELVAIARAELDGRPLEARATSEIGRSIPSLVVLPEARALVPGVEQRVLLRLTDEDGRPVSVRGKLEADGLAVEVATDARGEAAVRYTPPRTVGSRHPSGACASEVAATFRLTIPTAELRACVEVDRDAVGLLRATPPIALAGSPIELEIVGDAREWQIAAASAPAFLGYGKGKLRVSLPGEGAVAIGARLPGSTARLLGTTVLLRPSFSRLSIVDRGGPRGFAELEVTLTNERGEPLVGAVSAAAVELGSGGSLAGALELDAARALFAGAELGSRGYEELLADTELVRATAIRGLGAELHLALEDPITGLEARVAETFKGVVRQLEGAVYEAATRDPRDARAIVGGRATFNPELLTSVTAAMDEPPTTPGGEPIELADLIAIDPSVRYELVARRVARLQLFRVWAALREQLAGIGVDEPMLRDPPALLRRLVREGAIEPSSLVDAWGGAIGFVPGRGKGLPYFGVRTHHLAASGPDGILGTRDDLEDPFERVLASGTPYAIAVDEDALVDARDDIVVGDAVVERWREVLERGTGDVFGGGSGALSLGGLSGSGAGGGGLGASGGVSRTQSLVSGTAFVRPVATDALGRARILVPIGVESTWRIAVIGLPAKGATVVDTLDVARALPLSVRVELGRGWHVGDRVDARVFVRSRAKLALEARVRGAASGGALGALDASVRVEPGAIVELPFSLSARGRGPASVSIGVTGGGFEDAIEASFAVDAAATALVRAASRAIEGEQSVAVPEAGQARGPVRLIVSRGLGAVARRAIEGMEPSVEALELAGRAGCCEELVEASIARLEGQRLTWLDRLRAAPHSRGRVRPAAPCPPASERPTSAEALIDALAAEPAPIGGSVRSCWDELAADAAKRVAAEDVAATARLVIALAHSPHRRLARDALSARLRARVREDGRLRIEDPSAEPLLRAALGADVTSLERADGGFGDRQTTRYVLLALSGVERAPGSCEVLARPDDGPPISLELPGEGRTAATFGSRTKSVAVASSCRVLARVEQPAERAWSEAPRASGSGLSISAEWPRHAIRGARTIVELRLASAGGAEAVTARVPLPPGAHLYEAASGVRESLGELTIERRIGDVPEIVRIAVRFTLAGELAIPEAELRSAERGLEPAFAAATAVTVAP